MDKFRAITAFVRVAESGGFTAAGNKLGMSVSAITKSVARLEDELGTQLFNRTTRRLATTDFGKEFYKRCVQILAELEDAEQEVRQANTTPKGEVRVVVPFSYGRVTVTPRLPDFYARYPEVQLNISFSDRPVDLIENGYDLAVRVGEMSDSRLITRLLTKGPHITVASPRYLEKYGTPKTPQDLEHHNCIIGRYGPEWMFRAKNGRSMNVRVRGNLQVYNGDSYREAAVSGIGLAQNTWWLFRWDLQAGDVVPVLEDYAVDGAPVSVVYPANRHVSAKVRAFINFLVEISKRDVPKD
ncbi:MAG TPA: LysR family transcriptional regulator [Xanthobacteraceae bacterium]|nr:LysR family transcriptional regulator [Xanthobacteraceae bacterium]